MYLKEYALPVNGLDTISDAMVFFFTFSTFYIVDTEDIKVN